MKQLKDFNSTLLKSFWFKLIKFIVFLYQKLALKADLNFKTSLPNEPKIFVVNHPSSLDPIYMMSLFPQQLAIMVHETLFKVPVLGFLLKKSGHIKVIEGKGSEVLAHAQNIIENGKSVMAFLEGNTSFAITKLRKAKTGAVRLALMTGAPIVPVGIYLDFKKIKVIEAELHGRYERGQFYLSGPYKVTVGKPIYLKGDIEDRSYVRKISKKLIELVIDLIKQSEKRTKMTKGVGKLLKFLTTSLRRSNNI